MDNQGLEIKGIHLFSTIQRQQQRNGSNREYGEKKEKSKNLSKKLMHWELLDNKQQLISTSKSSRLHTQV